MKKLICIDNHSYSDGLINSYLTIGGVYSLVSSVSDDEGFIYDDEGDRIFVNHKKSDHGSFLVIG